MCLDIWHTICYSSIIIFHLFSNYELKSLDVHLLRGAYLKLYAWSVVLSIPIYYKVFTFIYPEHQWLTVALAMLAKFGAAGGFGTIYLYSTELFPTLIRNSAIGASSSWARAGAMLAPYVAAQVTIAEILQKVQAFHNFNSL